MMLTLKQEPHPSKVNGELLEVKIEHLQDYPASQIILEE